MCTCVGLLITFISLYITNSTLRILGTIGSVLSYRRGSYIYIYIYMVFMNIRNDLGRLKACCDTSILVSVPLMRRVC